MMSSTFRSSAAALCFAALAPLAVGSHTPSGPEAAGLRIGPPSQGGPGELQGQPVYTGSTYAGPDRYVRDPVYGDTIYGGVNAAREASQLGRPVQMRLGLSVLSASETDLNDSDGDVDVNRGGLDFGVDIPLGPGSGLSFSSAYELSRYNFDGVSGSSFGVNAPFGTVHIASLSGSIWQRMDNGFTGFATYTLGAGWQEGSEPAEGQSYLLSVGGTYKAEEDLHLGFAIMAIDLLEKGLTYLIYPIIDWRIAPEWRVATAESGLPGVALFFEPEQRFSLYGALGLELRQFRADDTGPLDGLAVRDERIRAAGGLRWRAGANMVVWIEGGLYPFQRYEAFDRDGNTQAKERTDANLFAAARVQFSF